MSRKLCITAADGQTGHLVTELLLTDDTFTSQLGGVFCLTLNPAKCKDLQELGAEIIHQKPGDAQGLAGALKSSGVDTIFLIPPAHKHKLKLTEEIIQAVRKAEVRNTVLLSSAGADFAEERKHPRLREFIHIEAQTMETRYLANTKAGTSQAVLRASFYAENLLLYNKDAQKNGKLRLPIGQTHSFAPVALGDVAQLAAHILVSEGPQGLSDNFRGQLIVLTGPMMVNGTELAQAASEAGLSLEFEDISDKEAKQLLDADTDVDDSEKQYLLEYYSLVREGMTNYVSTIPYKAIIGTNPTQPPEFFKTYNAEFKPKKRKLQTKRSED